MKSDPQNETRVSVQRHRRIAVLCLGIAAVALVWVFKDSFRAIRLHSHDQNAVAAPTPVDTSQRATQPPFASRQTVAHSSDHPLASDSNALRSQQLILVSTSPGRTPNEGTAELCIDGRAAQTFVGGARLANGARLAEIYSDRVVLKRGEASAVIWLGNGASRQGNADAVLASGAPLKTTLPSSITNRISIALRPSPAYEEGAFVGLELYPGSNRSLFSQLGFRSGDLLVAVEGVPIADYFSGAQMLEALADGATMSLTVRRGNHQQIIQAEGGLIVSALNPANVQTAAQPSMQLPPG